MAAAKPPGYSLREEWDRLVIDYHDARLKHAVRDFFKAFEWATAEDPDAVGTLVRMVRGATPTERPDLERLTTIADLCSAALMMTRDPFLQHLLNMVLAEIGSRRTDRARYAGDRAVETPVH